MTEWEGRGSCGNGRPGAALAAARSRAGGRESRRCRRRLPVPAPEGGTVHDHPGLRGRGRRRTREQFRKSGESYINHPLAVARIVADIGLDETTVAAALLHDAVEDTEVTLADVEREFGAEVATIVDGVTKLERIRFDSKEEQQAATMRKMLVAMAKDLRVLIIKLADRLHNMRTLAAMPEREAAAHRAGDARHLRARWRTASACRRSSSSSRTCRSRRCTRSATPRSTTWSSTRTPERDDYLAEVARRGPRRASPSSASTPR